MQTAAANRLTKIFENQYQDESPNSHVIDTRIQRIKGEPGKAGKAKAGKAKESATVDSRAELHLGMEIDEPFTEFEVSSNLLLDKLHAKGLCFFRAHPSHWDRNSDCLYQFGIYGPMSIAYLLSHTFDVVSIIGEILDEELTKKEATKNQRAAYKQFEPLFREFNKILETVKAGNQLVRQDINTPDIKSLLLSIKDIFFKLEESYESEENEEMKILYQASWRLIRNLLLIKSSLDGEQSAQLWRLAEAESSAIFFETSDRSAASDAVSKHLPVLTEATYSGTKTQFLLDSIVVSRFLRLSAMTNSSDVENNITANHSHSRSTLSESNSSSSAAAADFMEPNETMDLDDDDDKTTAANVKKTKDMIAFGKRHSLFPEQQQHHDTPMDMDIDHNSSENESTMVVETSPHVEDMMRLRRTCRGLRKEMEENSEDGWTCSSTSLKSKRFCNTMDKTIGNKSVYEWLSDPSMDTWLPSDCQVDGDTALKTSRSFFNYHTLTPDRRHSTCMDNPTLNATCLLDHDHEGLCTREFLGIPLMFKRLICRFASLRGVDINDFIGKLEFEAELERRIQANFSSRDSFWDGFEDWLKSDPLISSCLPDEMVQAMLEEFNTTNSKDAEDNPPQDMRTTRQKRKNNIVKSRGESDLKKAKETTKYPELNGLVRLRPEAQEIFEAVFLTIKNETTAKFEERQRLSSNRCVMLQLPNMFDKRMIYISTRNAAFTSVEPHVKAIKSTNSFSNTFYFPPGTIRATDLPCAVTSCPHALQLESMASKVDAANCRYFPDAVTVHHRVGAELRYNGIVVGFVHSAKPALVGEVPPEASHPFIREFITKWNGKKPAAITADRVQWVLDTLTRYTQDRTKLNLYNIIMYEIQKIKQSDTELGGIIEEAYNTFYSRMNEHKRTLKKRHAGSFWEFLGRELRVLLSKINTNLENAKNHTILEAIHTILKYLDVVVFSGVTDFNHVLLRLRHLSKCSNPQGNKRGGGWWDNVLGNTNKKVLGYSFADVGNDLVLKPIYSEEEYKKLKHRQYINILLNIRQQQIENRIKQEQQTILNKQKPMISTIRKYLGLKPLRPVISYPQSHQPDLSKQKTMLSAVGNTIKRINPFKTPVYIRREGGKFTKKIKKTKQTRKYKPLSNKRTSYKLYR